MTCDASGAGAVSVPLSHTQCVLELYVPCAVAFRVLVWIVDASLFLYAYGVWCVVCVTLCCLRRGFLVYTLSSGYDIAQSGRRTKHCALVCRRESDDGRRVERRSRRGGTCLRCPYVHPWPLAPPTFAPKPASVRSPCSRVPPLFESPWSSAARRGSRGLPRAPSRSSSGRRSTEGRWWRLVSNAASPTKLQRERSPSNERACLASAAHHATTYPPALELTSNKTRHILCQTSIECVGLAVIMLVTVPARNHRWTAATCPIAPSCPSVACSPVTHRRKRRS